MSREKFDNTVAKHSSEELAILKLDQVIELLRALMAKLDSDIGVSDADFATLLTDDVQTASERMRRKVKNDLSE